MHEVRSDELAFGRRAMKRTLTAHPRLEWLRAKMTSLVESLVALQYETARRVRMQYVVRNASGKP